LGAGWNWEKVVNGSGGAGKALEEIQRHKMFLKTRENKN